MVKATDQFDTIVNGNGISTSPASTLSEAASANQLWFEQSGNNLIVDVLGTNRETVIQNWYSSGQQQLQQIVSGDGLHLDTGLQQLVQAMTQFSAANPTFNPMTTAHTNLTDAYFGTLAAADTSSWHA